MRNYEEETKKRVAYIQERLTEAHADGIVFGNSGGKDCALVGILCKMACEKTVSIMMPCMSTQNFGSDMQDAIAVCEKYHIENRTVDLSNVKQQYLELLKPITNLTDASSANIAPRLRMTTLYAIGQSENCLVAGTGNRSEVYMGYFTKWGDGAYDFDPISDLTVTEVYEFLRHLGAPESIIKKAPSAGLFEGQTDEKEMGVSYASIDKVLMGEPVSEKDAAIIERYHSRSNHKRQMPSVYKHIDDR